MSHIDQASGPQDWAAFKALPAEERDALGFRQWRMLQRIGSHWKGCWKDGGPQHWQCAVREAESWYQQSQDRTDDALKFAGERDQLRALLRELLRTTSAHHQSPGDLPIQAAYVAARDAAAAACGREMSGKD